jgi:response regulator of citrate/malate metabolism
MDRYRHPPHLHESASTNEVHPDQSDTGEPSGRLQTATLTESADLQFVDRIRAEYEEMPGMSLTLDQVVRLCGIERSKCRRVLDTLVATEFLSLRSDGAYARRIDEPIRIRMATSQLREYERPSIRRRAS